ncbi:cyclophilin-type peptidyl-prolyl cis-trans isomerase [Tribonema minus]|uniref:Cyclophilin-type peptidyl-prolyl cis-trans isomerase n=1 Tax=Tribonema minus TaxID=303371 RepID=A0A835YS24_9STRA|nr:cyclophilin-type peptidyl-prolyl cis-trans isomerase [Tribonema minus]
MSNVYHTEPPTSGKVLLRTTYGDIDVELWPKEAPRACRNFLQLAMEGYYDNTVFHRIISKFMVQGGDPTGTGKGGDSIWGKPFKDECHSRIKFNHRGQVAMANENTPNTNRSQFFFTLDKADWLNGKHTIFGKITGNTIFNALRMGDAETDDNDRPVDPPKLVGIDVLHNPFDDIVPRASKAKAGADATPKPKAKPKGKKDFKLLSFGEEAQEEEQQAASTGGIKSAHDMLRDEKLSAEAAYADVDVEQRRASGRGAGDGDEQLPQGNKRQRRGDDATDRAAALGKGADDDEGDGDDGDTFMERMKRQMRDKRRKLEGPQGGGKGGGEEPPDLKAQYEEDELDKMRQERSRAAQEKAQEYERLRSELRAKHRATKVVTGEERQKLDAQQAHQEMLSPLEQMRQKYKRHKGAESGSRETDTMAKLAAFSKKIRIQHGARAHDDEQLAKERKEEEAYHGQVTEGALYEGEDSGDEAKAWFSAPLKFKGAKHIDDGLRAGTAATGSDGRKASDYTVLRRAFLNRVAEHASHLPSGTTALIRRVDCAGGGNDTLNVSTSS